MRLDGVSPPILYFFFKVNLGVLGPFHVHIDFKVNLSTSEKKKMPAGILNEIELNLQIKWERIVTIIMSLLLN